MMIRYRDDTLCMFIRYAVMMAIIDRNVVTMIAFFFCLLGGHSISGHSISGHQNESSIPVVGLTIVRLGVLLGGLSFGKFVPVGANQRGVEHRMFFRPCVVLPHRPLLMLKVPTITSVDNEVW